MGTVWSWLIGEDLSTVDASSIHLNCHIHYVDYKKSESKMLEKVQLFINRYSLINDVIGELQSHEKFSKINVDLHDTKYKLIIKNVAFSKDERLCCIGVNDYNRIEFWDETIVPRGMTNVIENIHQNNIVFLNNKDAEQIVMKSLHMSCKSHNIDLKSDYIGLILYSYNAKDDWKLNGVHCKTGYIIIRKSKQLLSDLKNVSVTFKPNTMHCRLYYWLFHELPNEQIIAGGFAIRNGEIKFNSTTFNYNASEKNSGIECSYHDNDRSSHPLEQKWIKIALKNWKNGKQNTLIQEPKDICWKCVTEIHTIRRL